MELQNKVSLITGGARVGREVAVQLAARGSDLVLTYRNSKQSAEEVKRTAESFGRKTLLVQSDLLKSSDVSRVTRHIKKEFGRLDVLVYMASVYFKTPFRKLNASAWDQNMGIHLKSAYELALGCVPLMTKNGGGRMIYFTDWTSASGRPRYYDFLPYYVSKAGILGLVESLALELAPGILVNAVAPGPILPPRGMSQKKSTEVKRLTPLRKWGGPEEISKAVLFFIESNFVTGECLRVDGGRHLY